MKTNEENEQNQTAKRPALRVSIFEIANSKPVTDKTNQSAFILSGAAIVVSCRQKLAEVDLMLKGGAK